MSHPFELNAIRRAFPAISSASTAKSFVYLDSAATMQKPQVVIDCINDFYRTANGNVHRATHQFAANSTAHFEAARQTVADFIGAPHKNNIVFTRGATEAINLIAYSYGMHNLKAGDEIIISEMEHHANLVPWQQLAKKVGAKIIPLRMDKQSCRLDLSEFDKLLTIKTKLVAIAHTSNVTGTRHPIEQIIEKAHKVGAVVVVDAAQGIVHEKIDVGSIDADFLVFSGHKIFAPTGIGALYGKGDLLAAMPPWQLGGKMITKVSFDETTFVPPPARFEAGTPNVAGAIALGTAINWFKQINSAEIKAHIHRLRSVLVEELAQIDGVQLIGLQPGSSTVAFNIEGIHHSDLATLLSNQGIAIRTGKHCAEPFMDALGINGCARISIALYNNESDIQRCIAAIKKAVQLFS